MSENVIQREADDAKRREQERTDREKLKARRATAEKHDNDQRPEENEREQSEGARIDRK